MAGDDIHSSSNQSISSLSLANKSLIGEEHLNPTQIGLIHDAINRSKQKSFRGLLFHLPMGSGKSRLSLILGLNLYKQFLIIASKSLISNWIEEIAKVWPGSDQPKYEIVHRDYLGSGIDSWKPKTNTQIIITTPETIRKSYNDNNIESYYVGVTHQHSRKIFSYHLPIKRAFRSSSSQGPLLFHGMTFEGIFVDEAQNFTNISTDTCRAISSLCTPVRFLLSGTPIQEPKLERLLGLFQLLNYQYPNSLSQLDQWISSGQYQGITPYSLTCDPPSIDAKLHTIRHHYDMTPSEVKIFEFFKEIVVKWYEYYQLIESRADPDLLRQIRGHLLSILTYTRIAIVAPKVGIDALVAKIGRESFLKGLDETIQELKPHVTEAVHYSSRLEKVCELMLEYPEQKFLVFSSFVQTLETCRQYLMKHDKINYRKFYLYHSGLSTVERGQLLNDFRKETNAVLFLSYSIGAEGINLQCTNQCIFLEPFWNSSRENQAIARCYRYGQQSDVYEHHITSTTMFEFQLINKQMDKTKIITDMLTGAKTFSPKFKITSISYLEMVNLIAKEDIDVLYHPKQSQLPLVDESLDPSASPKM